MEHAIEISITIKASSIAAMQSQLANALAALETCEASPSLPVPDLIKIPVAKAASKKAETEEADFDLDQASDELDDGAPTGDDEYADDLEAAPATKATASKKAKVETKAKKIGLNEMIKAFQDYAAANSRAEAGKILAKFKVKGVKDLDEKDYEKVLKLLKV